MPAGASYIYDLNFFAGFLVASGTYWILCKLSPIRACSERWLEVGDEIRNVSVAYGAGGGLDGDSGSGSGIGDGSHFKGDEEYGSLRVRKVATNNF